MKLEYVILGLLLVGLTVSAQAVSNNDSMNMYEIRAAIASMQQEQRAFYTAYNGRIDAMEANMTTSMGLQLNYAMDQKFNAFDAKMTDMIATRVNPLNFAPAYVLCVVMGIAIGGILVSWRNTM